MNTKIIIIILLLLILIISAIIKNKIETFNNHPSPSPNNSTEFPSASPNNSTEFPSPSTNDSTELLSQNTEDNKKNNKETTIFFISDLPNKNLTEKLMNKLKDITKKSVTNEIKNTEIIYKIDMKMEDLTEKMKEEIILQIRYEILNRLNKELKLPYNPNQISITFSSGSVIITVKILSLEEVKKSNNYLNEPNKSKNYIQYKSQGKTGMYIPTTIIGGVEQDFDELSSSMGGMSLT